MGEVKSENAEKAHGLKKCQRKVHFLSFNSEITFNLFLHLRNCLIRVELTVINKNNSMKNKQEKNIISGKSALFYYMNIENGH
jgi:hypothetical protein